MAESKSIDFLTPVKGPELVFGLVGPIGVDMRVVSSILSEELSRVKYKSVEIHVTDLFSEIDKDYNLKSAPLEERYSSYIKAGNDLRADLGRADAFSLFCVAAIRRRRSELSGDRDTPKNYTAYILNQFKRPEEIETLRRVYGRGFVQISAYGSKNVRLSNLTRRISESHYREKNDEFYRGRSYDLIARDNSEVEVTFGQRVKDTFPLADVIINANGEDELRISINRFIKAFFGDNFVTPTKEEYGIFAAHSASLRSADLARQVGAVIVSPAGEILATGCNEVPKAGGGTYWTDSDFDYRDFKLGYDSSVRFRKEIVLDLFRRLKDKDWFSDNIKAFSLDDLYKLSVENEEEQFLKESFVMDLLEYGRMVHAEMCAITDAARTGQRLEGTTLYSTTFPCHMCARHIVAAGISRVVYIEPYSKSLVSDLYPDSVSIEGEQVREGPKVNFEPFIGIAPERYTEIFKKGRRKNKDGSAVFWDPQISEPILKRLVPAYITIEKGVLDALNNILTERKIGYKNVQ